MLPSLLLQILFFQSLCWKTNISALLIASLQRNHNSYTPIVISLFRPSKISSPVFAKISPSIFYVRFADKWLQKQYSGYVFGTRKKRKSKTTTEQSQKASIHKYFNYNPRVWAFFSLSVDFLVPRGLHLGSIVNVSQCAHPDFWPWLAAVVN